MVRPELVITNIGFLFSIIITFALGFFVLYKGPRKSANILYFALSFTTVIWLISHLIGINVSDGELSRQVFMFNTVTMFVIIINAHLVFSILGTVKKHLRSLLLFYAVGAGLTVFFFLFPSSFMLTSAPKFYFVNYYVKGNLYFLSDLYFFSTLIYSFYFLVSGYRNATDRITKNRLKYFILSMALGYSLGLVLLLPLYGINIDPVVSIFFGLYSIPMAYSIVEYNLVDINLVAKRAFFYSVGVVLISILLVSINALNDLLVAAVPGFPMWLVPVFSSVASVSIGWFVWNKINEVNKLKYEFITVITHKFRTPLTYMKWSLDALMANPSEADRVHSLDTIKSGVFRLVQLTDVITGLDTDTDKNLKPSQPVDLLPVLSSVIEDNKNKIAEKNISVSTQFPKEPVLILADRQRIAMALQIIFENALVYTGAGGKIECRISGEKGKYFLRISDDGIGIPKEEAPYIFNKFFRGSEAKRIDTEGLGVGLFIAREIINQNGGAVSFSSAEAGKGTTFTVSFNIYE